MLKFQIENLDLCMCNCSQVQKSSILTYDFTFCDCESDRKKSLEIGEF